MYVRFSLASGRREKKVCVTAAPAPGGGSGCGGGAWRTGGVGAKPTHDIDFQLEAPTKPTFWAAAVTDFLIVANEKALPLE